jgi:hypothetical protein
MRTRRVILRTSERRGLAEIEAGLGLIDADWSVIQAADDVLYRARRSVAVQFTQAVALLPKTRRWCTALLGGCAGVAVLTGGSALAIKHVLDNH